MSMMLSLGYVGTKRKSSPYSDAVSVKTASSVGHQQISLERTPNHDDPLELLNEFGAWNGS